MHKQLFIPGPVEVRADVLERMATPMVGHRSKECAALQESISKKLQQVFQTENIMVLSTSSGSGLMESAIRCCTGKKAAVFSIGSFGDRWYKMAVANGKEADKFRMPDGQATDPAQVEEVLATGEYDLITVTHNETATGTTSPIAEIGEVLKKYPNVVYCVDTVSSMGGVDIPVDEIGIDFCVTSAQKCLGLPPGMSVASVSEKAYERAKTVPNRGLYFDIVEIYEKTKKSYQYPSTPSISHMYAMDYQLSYMLEVEGLQNRWNRHAEMAAYVQNWARKYFGLFADEAHLSNTVTCIENTRGINVAELNNKLGERGMNLSNGYGDLKEKTFRIAHMADTTMEDIKKLTSNIEDILGL